MPYIKQAVWQIKEKKEVSKNEGKICIDFSINRCIDGRSGMFQDNGRGLVQWCSTVL